MSNNNMRRIFISCISIGVFVLISTFYYYRSPEFATAVRPAATVEYGYEILRQTSSIIGPNQADPEKRFSGTNMACASCHLDTGRTPGTLSLLQASARYPRFSGRDGGERDLIDRINGCMQRSMNGRPLPRNSIEMLAMEAYILNLGEQYAAMGEGQRAVDEPAAFAEPPRKASIEAGKQVYDANCEICHGENGYGLKSTDKPADGYLFPPLWGEDSYNNGAGMTRVLTAARFIKARMPLGKADLTDDEAYDVAAYINSKERPIKNNLEDDFPDLRRKHVDSPYLPYADPFTQEQHRLGPFAPIREYYQNLKE